MLTKERLLAFFDETLRTLGTAACPPYHLSVVIGGTSAELNLKTVKLASCRYLDTLPTQGDASGHAIRDPELEAEILELTQNFGIGAQFGGKYFCHDIRVIRLPRHGASLPIGIGVSCAADRQALGKITAEGVFLEQLEANPARFMPDIAPDQLSGDVVAIDLNRPMDEIRKTLSDYPIKTRISVSGPMIVARDAAHARLRAGLGGRRGSAAIFQGLLHLLRRAGKDPKRLCHRRVRTDHGGPHGFLRRSVPKATAPRWVMLAKGNRSDQVTKACADHGGFYLGSIGGPGARLAQDCIKSVDCVAYEDLGMEAIWKIEVEDFPAFIVVDDKGNDFFSQLNRR